MIFKYELNLVRREWFKLFSIVTTWQCLVSELSEEDRLGCEGQVFWDWASHCGPCHQSDWSLNSLGEMPWVMQSVGFCLLGTWNQLSSCVNSSISANLTNTNGLKSWDCFLIHVRTMADQTIWLIVKFKVDLILWHHWLQSNTDESSSLRIIMGFQQSDFGLS